MNQCFKQMDDIFHAYAASHGLSDSAFWILYTLYESDTPYTQNDLCMTWYYPKQTIHSAVANLVKAGHVSLVPMPNRRNSKRIVLTASGRAYAQTHVGPLLAAEERAFAQLTKEERDAYLRLAKKHLALLSSAVDAVMQQPAGTAPQG